MFSGHMRFQGLVSRERLLTFRTFVDFHFVNVHVSIQVVLLCEPYKIFTKTIIY